MVYLEALLDLLDQIAEWLDDPQLSPSLPGLRRRLYVQAAREASAHIRREVVSEGIGAGGRPYAQLLAQLSSQSGGTLAATVEIEQALAAARRACAVYEPATDRTSDIVIPKLALADAVLSAQALMAKANFVSEPKTTKAS